MGIGIVKKERSAELRAAQEKIEIARMQTELAKERAKAAKIEAEADRRAARNERYRAVTKTRSANGGISIKAVAANVEDLPKGRAAKGGRSAAAGKARGTKTAAKGRQGSGKRR